MEYQDKEIRSLESQVTAGSDRTITGMAIVFNKLSELLESGGQYFREIILPSTLDNGFIDRMDIVALWNHEDHSGILARSRKGIGTLNLTVNEYGLQYSFKARNTALGNEVYEAVKSGDIHGSSFAFRAKSDRWEKQKDGTFIRYISAFESVTDISIVVRPAYSASSVTARSMRGATTQPSGLDSYFAGLQKEIQKVSGCPPEQYFQNLKNQLK